MVGLEHTVLGAKVSTISAGSPAPAFSVTGQLKKFLTGIKESRPHRISLISNLDSAIHIYLTLFLWKKKK